MLSPVVVPCTIVCVCASSSASDRPFGRRDLLERGHHAIALVVRRGGRLLEQNGAVRPLQHAVGEGAADVDTDPVFGSLGDAALPRLRARVGRRHVERERHVLERSR